MPADLSRVREVWTDAEVRALDRATKLLTARGLKFQFACTHERCAGERIERVRNLDGSITLRCAHKDRVMQGAF